MHAGITQSGDLMEHVVDVLTQRRVACKQAKVGVHARRAGMVVTRAQVGIAPELCAVLTFFTANDKCQFGMRLIAYDSVHHVCAGFLQALCGFDIGFFVKAGHQLDHYGDFLAALRGLDQLVHQL